MDTAGNAAIHHNPYKPGNAIPLMSWKKAAKAWKCAGSARGPRTAPAVE